MKEFEYIAYEGKYFTIEWYFNHQQRAPALKYYRRLCVDERIKILKLFKRISDNGEIKDRTKFNYEGDKIYVFKSQPERFLCFFCEGKKIIVTNAFRKKRQSMPAKEKLKALNYMKGYLVRIKEGNYYE